MQTTSHSALIVGCGYVGRRLADRLCAAGRPVTAVTRSGRLPPLEHLRSLAWDLDAEPAPRLEPPASVFYLAPPPSEGEGDTRLERCLRVLESILPQRLIYLSTSGVYGDCAGALVDEDRAPAPQTARARRRLAAERCLQAWAEMHGPSWTILRVPGIYGPGRLPLGRLREGAPFLDEADAPPGNRVLVHDLVDCLLAADSPRAAGKIYNVGDGDHRSATAFAARVSSLAGMPAPRTVSLNEARTLLSPLQWSFLAESRRLDSGRIRRELSVRFTPPEEGIRRSLGEG